MQGPPSSIAARTWRLQRTAKERREEGKRAGKAGDRVGERGAAGSRQLLRRAAEVSEDQSGAVARLQELPPQARRPPDRGGTRAQPQLASCSPAKVRASPSGTTTVSCSNMGRKRRVAPPAAAPTGAAATGLPSEPGDASRELARSSPLLPPAPCASWPPRGPDRAAERRALGSPSCSSPPAPGRARLRLCRSAIPRAPPPAGAMSGIWPGACLHPPFPASRARGAGSCRPLAIVD